MSLVPFFFMIFELFLEIDFFLFYGFAQPSLCIKIGLFAKEFSFLFLLLFFQLLIRFL